MTLLNPAAHLGVLSALHVASNIYIQIGIVPLIMRSGKSAILIAEFVRDLHERQRVSLMDAAPEAARSAVSAHSDDVFRLHSRCPCACAGHRCRHIHETC